MRFLGIISLVAGLLGAPAAWACSCATPDPDSLVAGSSLIFEGALVSTRQLSPSDCDEGFCSSQVESVFRVDQPFKGDVGGMVALRYVPQDGGNCGPSFRPYSTQIIAASLGADGHYYVGSMCSQGAGTFGRDHTRVLEALARFQQLLAVYDVAIHTAPGTAGPVIEKARFLAETRNLPEALAVLHDLLSQKPYEREAVLLAAKLHTQFRQDELSLAILEPFLAYSSNDPYAARLRVANLLRLGRMDEIDLGWRDFTSLSAGKLDFSGRTLDGASFREAYLPYVDLAETSLKQADFSGSRLAVASLDGADLTGANLTNASVSGSLQDVTLESVTLDKASLSFSGKIASLKGATLTRASFRSPRLQMVADYRSERLRVGSLENIDASGVAAQRASFVALRMAAANFSSADLEHARFQFLNLDRALFRGANLQGASFCEADLSNADFANANLRRASFLSVKLDGVRLDGAVFDSETAWPEGFDPLKAGGRMDGDPAKGIKRAIAPTGQYSWPCN